MKKSLGSTIAICPSPVWCIGTFNENGTANVMTASWAGICCSEPPCLAVSLRKATHTYGNIVRTKAFTVSLPSKKYAKEADYFGIVSGKKVNKFNTSGLTPVKGDKVNAPYVGEFPMAVECQLTHTLNLGLHTLFVGQILDVKADEAMLNSNGLPDMSKMDPFVYSAADQEYHGVGPIFGDAFRIGLIE